MSRVCVTHSYVIRLGASGVPHRWLHMVVCVWAIDLMKMVWALYMLANLYPPRLRCHHYGLFHYSELSMVNSRSQYLEARI